MTFYSHPLVQKDVVEAREYQVAIAKNALKANTLVVLPTGLGKTPTALMVMAPRLSSGKIVLVAPTKPLCQQHYDSFRKFFISSVSITLLTGEVPTEKRKASYMSSQVIIATPQTLDNDLRSGLYSFSSVSLLVLDEAHHATGEYSYVPLATAYEDQAGNKLILALTASPGGVEAKVDQIKAKLFIEQTEIRTERSPDVIPYLHDKQIEVIKVKLPELLKWASDILNTQLKEEYKVLKSLGYIPHKAAPNAGDLETIRRSCQDKISQGDGNGYAGVLCHAKIMKLRHAVICAESQGLLSLREYLQKMKDDSQTSKASKHLCSVPDIYNLICHSSEWTEEIHPKIQKLLSLVFLELDRHPDSRILIFASYRDTVSYLTNLLLKHGFKASSFTGQAKGKKSAGMSQKRQTETIRKFREGTYQVLISTSVGEEGLDIPSCDVVIFYESVPSEVRDIQRMGRTGRFGVGRVMKLVTAGTIDEKYHHIAMNKGKEMQKRVSAAC